MTQPYREAVEQRTGEVGPRGRGACENALAAVRLVAEQRTSQIAQVQADLVRPPGLRERRDQGGAGVALDHAPPRQRRPRPDGTVVDAFIAGGRRRDQRAILLAHPVGAEFQQERRLRAPGTREDGDSGRAAVEAVDEQRLRPPLAELPQERAAEFGQRGAAGEILVRRHSRGLVDGEHLLVQMEDAVTTQRGDIRRPQRQLDPISDVERDRRVRYAFAAAERAASLDGRTRQLLAASPAAYLAA